MTFTTGRAAGALGLAAALLLAACSAAPSHDPLPAPITIATPSRLTVVVTPGPAYQSVIRVLFVTLKRPATFACWLETPGGAYVDTIFASHNAAKGEWYAHPQGQPGALPVWAHAAAAQRSDAVSGATPKPGMTLSSGGKNSYPAGMYVVKFEINQAHDNNAYFPANLATNDPRYSGDNGQPSVVYSGSLEIGNGPRSVRLQVAGTGAVNGQDGNLHGLEGLTTALRQVEGIEIRCRD